MMRHSKLPSGLDIVSWHLPGLETVFAGLYARAGSRAERANENGLAHLFEHMVFKGAAGRTAREIAEAVEDTGGDLNAATGRDTTVFSARLLAGDLPLGIELLADMVERPAFDAEELKRERNVVLQEIGEVRDMPGDLVFDHLYEAAFPGQALGRAILGTEASLAGFDVADLRSWQKRHYTGDGLSLVVAGHVDHAELEALAEKHFTRAAASANHNEPLQSACFVPGVRTDDAPLEQAHLTSARKAPPVRERAYLAARLFAEALGGGMSSRLFQDLREARGLAYSVYAGVQPFDDISLFYTYAAVAPEDAVEAAERIQAGIVDAASSLQPRELQRARAQVKAGLLMSLETPEGRAAFAARQLALYGRLGKPSELVAELDAVTLDEARAAGQAIAEGPEALASIGAGRKRAAA